MEWDSMELTSYVWWHHMSSMSYKYSWKDLTPLTTVSPVSSGLAKKSGISESSNSPW